MKCPGCGGRPFVAFGYDTSRRTYTLPVECPHVCDERAKAGDYELCLCCKECMTEGRVCGTSGSCDS